MMHVVSKPYPMCLSISMHRDQCTGKTRDGRDNVANA